MREFVLWVLIKRPLKYNYVKKTVTERYLGWWPRVIMDNFSWLCFTPALRVGQDHHTEAQFHYKTVAHMPSSTCNISIKFRTCTIVEDHMSLIYSVDKNLLVIYNVIGMGILSRIKTMKCCKTSSKDVVLDFKDNLAIVWQHNPLSIKGTSMCQQNYFIGLEKITSLSFPVTRGHVSRTLKSGIKSFWLVKRRRGFNTNLFHAMRNFS